MKRFFEEYGGIALAILAVLVLIAIVSPVGSKIKESLTGTAKGFDNKMKNGLDNSGFGFGGTTEGGGGGTKPEQTVNLTSGQKLTIEGKEYTVIEQVEGNQYKVLATKTFQHNFDSSSNNYETSEIATYLDGEYYNSLDASIKSSIVETSIQQKVLKTWNGNNPTDWDTPKDAGTHKVFIPSWDEILKVYGGTSANEVKAYSYCGNTWLRDAYVNVTIIFMRVDGRIGGSYHPNSSLFVRPAFVLDLSKVTYTVK